MADFAWSNIADDLTLSVPWAVVYSFEQFPVGVGGNLFLLANL